MDPAAPFAAVAADDSGAGRIGARPRANPRTRRGSGVPSLRYLNLSLNLNLGEPPCST